MGGGTVPHAERVRIVLSELWPQRAPREHTVKPDAATVATLASRVRPTTREQVMRVGQSHANGWSTLRVPGCKVDYSRGRFTLRRRRTQPSADTPMWLDNIALDLEERGDIGCIEDAGHDGEGVAQAVHAALEVRDKKIRVMRAGLAAAQRLVHARGTDADATAFDAALLLVGLVTDGE